MLSQVDSLSKTNTDYLVCLYPVCIYIPVSYLHTRSILVYQYTTIIITSEREFNIGGSIYITGVLYIVTEPEGHLVSYSILCPLGPGALSGSKKLKRITVLIQKEPVSWSFVRPN